MHFAVKRECQGCWLWMGGRGRGWSSWGSSGIGTETQDQVRKMQVLSRGVNSLAWCLAGGEAAEAASSSEQLCHVVLEAQAQAGSLDTHHPLEDYHSCLDI